MKLYEQSSYSATVELYLQIGDERIPGSHLKPGEITLRSSREVPSETKGTIVVVIDGREKLYPVEILYSRVNDNGELCARYF